MNLMRKTGESYVHDGKHVAFIAKPNFTYTLISIAVLLVGGAIVLSGAWRAGRFAPIVRRMTRTFLKAAIGSSVFAGLGFIVLRVGPYVHVEGTWVDAADFDNVYENTSVNPIRVPKRIIKCTNGRVIETTLDQATLRWIFTKQGRQ